MRLLARALMASALLCSTVLAAEVKFSAAPTASRSGDKVTVRFAVAGPTDVEVAVLDKDGKVVRHLAAGVLGGPTDPPAPLAAGLSQELTWDGNDDSGQPVADKAVTVRVRAGTGVKMGRLLASSPWAIGKVTGCAADNDGNAYIMTVSGGTGSFKRLIAVDPDANYLRTIMPFPANLPAERISAWANYDTAPRPKNYDALGPEFYTNRSLSLLKAADAKGLMLTDGDSLFRVALDGGMVGESFAHGKLWDPKHRLPNTGGGPTHLTASPDGKYLYLSGPFSSNTQYGHKADPNFPPGRVYRMTIGQGTMEPFVDLPTIGKRSNAGWESKHISHPGNYTVPHGPIHDVAVDKDGNVLVADQDGQRIVVFSPEGKQIGEVKHEYPDILCVSQRTGAIYMLTKQIIGYQKFKKSLVKLSNWKEGKVVATLDLGTDRYATPAMALASGANSATLWISGLQSPLLRVSDKGEQFEIVGDISDNQKGSLYNADRLVVDYPTDTVYINNSWGNFSRINGITGEGPEPVRFEGDRSATDIAIDSKAGVIYAQLGPGYSGELKRYDRQLNAAPYQSTGSNELSKYIYGRYHGEGGHCEKGMGVSPAGDLYVMWMCGGWVRYGITGWSADGAVLNGKRGAIDPGHAKRGTPAELTQALISPLPHANAGVKVDSKGRLYVGVGVHPKDPVAPAGFEKDQAYWRTVGSIVRFRSADGTWSHPNEKKVEALDKKTLWFEPAPMPEGALEMNRGHYFTNADRCYGDYGPMSGGHADTGGIGEPGFCVCRTARFDIDPYDRLYIPNAVTNSVRIVDNNGNEICRFGSYANFDSGYVPAGQNKPLVDTPDVPLGWPVGVGVSAKHAYISDMLNRRVVRVDFTYAAEASCPVK